MGWEDRGEHGPYYTRSKRVGGRVVREYVGTGRAAEIAAEGDALERRRREEQRAEEAAALREERERLKVLDDPLEELCEIAEALARAVLLGAGYHRHRGEWRRRRISPEERSSTVGKLAKTEEQAHLELPKTEEGLHELIRRAETGDRAALPALRKVFDRAPFLAERCGDLAGRAERDLLDVMAPKDDLLAREAVPRKLKAMREELAGPSPTPMEKLMAERVTACWLALQHAELLVARKTFGNVSVEEIELYQRRLDRAHRRYLASIRTLAQIRKLGSTVQINIAEQQVNTVQ